MHETWSFVAGTTRCRPHALMLLGLLCAGCASVHVPAAGSNCLLSTLPTPTALHAQLSLTDCPRPCLPLPLPPAQHLAPTTTATASRGSRKTLGNFVKATFYALSHTYGFLSPDLWAETKYTKSPLQEFTDFLAKPAVAAAPKVDYDAAY
jgi:hypothetical protein